MTDILNDPLIKKYFGDNGKLNLESMAFDILEAMTTPIKKGELVLGRFPSNPDNEWQLVRAPVEINDIHSGWLRLPYRFQPKKDCGCTYCPDHGHKLPEGVAQKATPEQMEKIWAGPKPSPEAKCECDNDGEEYCPRCKKHKWPEADAEEKVIRDAIPVFEETIRAMEDVVNLARKGLKK